jgi:hypothetical protein
VFGFAGVLVLTKLQVASSLPMVRYSDPERMATVQARPGAKCSSYAGAPAHASESRACSRLFFLHHFNPGTFTINAFSKFIRQYCSSSTHRQGHFPHTFSSPSNRPLLTSYSFQGYVRGIVTFPSGARCGSTVSLIFPFWSQRPFFTIVLIMADLYLPIQSRPVLPTRQGPPK